MCLVSMKEMLIKAREGHYAVGQFNINNLEWTEAILDEAQALNTPVILGVSEGAAKYMGGWLVVSAMVKAYISLKTLLYQLHYMLTMVVHLKWLRLQLMLVSHQL